MSWWWQRRSATTSIKHQHPDNNLSSHLDEKRGEGSRRTCVSSLRYVNSSFFEFLLYWFIFIVKFCISTTTRWRRMTSRKGAQETDNVSWALGNIFYHSFHFMSTNYFSSACIDAPGPFTEWGPDDDVTSPPGGRLGPHPLTLSLAQNASRNFLQSGRYHFTPLSRWKCEMGKE